MIVIKKDFVPEDTRSYCANHFLASGKAYYMKDNNGNFHYGGRKCATDNTDTDLRTIPDLTKALITNVAGNPGNVGGNGNNGNPTVTDKSRAITYLILREEKLLNWPFIANYRFIQLTNLYNNYIQNNDLTQQEVSTVLFYISNSVNQHNSKLSLSNLENCYAYKYILERALSNTINLHTTNFIQSLQTQLENNATLNANQIQGLRTSLQYLPQMTNCTLRPF